MKYKLLKDLPYAKAGEVFERVIYKSKDGLSDCDYLKISKREKDSKNETIFTVYYNHFLGNFDEWFEEIEEPTDSIHWKPKYDDWYFYISDHGSVCSDIWNDNYTDNKRLAFGFVYRTEEECKAALDRELAEVRLRQTSDFEPDWEDGLQKKYVVIFNHVMKRLEIHELTFEDLNLPVYFESEDDASRAIYKHKADWLKYFGIKEEN